VHDAVLELGVNAAVVVGLACRSCWSAAWRGWVTTRWRRRRSGRGGRVAPASPVSAAIRARRRVRRR
jgi:hypothetical protein